MVEFEKISENLSTAVNLDEYKPNQIEINKYHGFNAVDESLVKDLLFALMEREVVFSVRYTQVQTVIIRLESMKYGTAPETNAEIIKILKDLTVCRAIIT